MPCPMARVTTTYLPTTLRMSFLQPTTGTLSNASAIASDGYS